MTKFLRAGREEREQCINGPRYSACWDPDEQPRLYDRTVDPDRQRDLAAQRPAVIEELMQVGARWPWDKAHPIAVRTPRYKLVAHPDPQGAYRFELYDLRADATEEADVSAAQPVVAEALRDELMAWFDDAPPVQHKQLDSDELDQLRALGYME